MEGDNVVWKFVILAIGSWVFGMGLYGLLALFTHRFVRRIDLRTTVTQILFWPIFMFWWTISDLKKWSATKTSAESLR